ncbi:MAG: hypothetical protein C0518_03475 [Opitutus sp.]|nr:hypothetical protein [Opitutus sp.]
MIRRLLLVFSVCVGVAAADVPDADLLRRADAGDVAACEQAAQVFLAKKKGGRDITKAAHYIRKALAENPAAPTAKALLGMLHFQGRGVPLDRELGRQLITEAAATGDGAAKEIARELEKRGHLSGLLPLERPEPKLLARAEEGDPEAQWQLAEEYINAWIENPAGGNPPKEWRERAAESGYARGQYWLSEGYRQGAYGYSKDPARALLWLKRAAEGGHPEAQARLGGMYLRGEGGLKKDDKEAARLLKAAVIEGRTDAEFYYGQLLYEGRGVPQNKEQGALHIYAAEKRGDLEARRYILAQAKKDALAIVDSAQLKRVLEQGVKDNDDTARAYLGIRLYTGDGLPKDVAAALPLLEKAAESGDFSAAHALVDHYGKKLTELQRQSQPDRSDINRETENYRNALILYGRNGHKDQRLEAAKALTNFILPTAPEMKAALAEPFLADAIVYSVALMRFYRNEGGTDRAGLAWLAAMEKQFKQSKWTDADGETALDLVRYAEESFPLPKK